MMIDEIDKSLKSLIVRLSGYPLVAMSAPIYINQDLLLAWSRFQESFENSWDEIDRASDQP